MPQVTEDVVAKIQKLLSLGQSSNENEAAQAMKFAQALMRKHNLDFATIKDAEAVASDAREKIKVDRSARYTWQRILWETLAKCNYCWYSTSYMWDKEADTKAVKPSAPPKEIGDLPFRDGTAFRICFEAIYGAKKGLPYDKFNKLFEPGQPLYGSEPEFILKVMDFGTNCSSWFGGGWETHSWQFDQYGGVYKIFDLRKLDKPRPGPRHTSNVRESRGKKRHVILGRHSNVIAVQTMGEYLEDTLSSMTAGLGDGAAINWKNGCVDRLVERIRENFDSNEGTGAATAEEGALILKSLADREHAGNYDFRNGEGAWARKLIADEKWERERQAEEERAEKEWLEYLANETPEQKERRRKEAERELRLRRSRSTGVRDAQRWATEHRKEAARVGNDFYKAGKKAGETISLNRQVGSGKAKQLR